MVKYILEITNSLLFSIKNGKGIYYYRYNDEIKRRKYEGDFKNDKREGKGIFYMNNGDRYEGDFKNGLRDGKGIFYYNNGDREMGDYLNDKRFGKHVTLKMNGEIISNNY